VQPSLHSHVILQRIGKSLIFQRDGQTLTKGLSSSIQSFIKHEMEREREMRNVRWWRFVYFYEKKVIAFFTWDCLINEDNTLQYASTVALTVALQEQLPYYSTQCSPMYKAIHEFKEKEQNKFLLKKKVPKLSNISNTIDWFIDWLVCVVDIYEKKISSMRYLLHKISQQWHICSSIPSHPTIFFEQWRLQPTYHREKRKKKY
jgi:hypothetical protein